MAAALANGDSPNSLQRNYQVVVAATRDMGIGKDGVLPWKLPADLKFFKELTLTTSDPAKKNAVIMGRKTWKSIPLKARPLPGRLNVILTRSGSFDFATAENVVICGSMNSALELLASTPYCLSIEKVFMIGGGQILRDSLNGPACEAIHLTDIQSDIECDTFIPPVDFPVFQLWCSSLPVVESNIRHSFVTYVRVRKSVLESHDSNGKESTENDTKSSKFEIENFSFLPKMIFERHEEYYYLNLVDDIIRCGAQKGLSPRDFIHVIGDAHVYRTHVRALEEQIQKLPKPFPILKINPLKKDIDSFEASDFKLDGYNPHKKIEMEMAI
ncbi:hypothetical protein ACQ4PT_016599 [Festuca glaucescens]